MIIFHVYGCLVGATGIHAAALIASKQICVNLLLQGYILLGVKAPFARMLFAPTSSAALRHLPPQARQQHHPRDGAGAAHRHRRRRLLWRHGAGGAVPIDMATLVLMLKGIVKTLRAPTAVHRALAAAARAMFQGTRREPEAEGPRRGDGGRLVSRSAAAKRRDQAPPSRRSVRGSAQLDMM